MEKHLESKTQHNTVDALEFWEYVSPEIPGVLKWKRWFIQVKNKEAEMVRKLDPQLIRNPNSVLTT